MRGSGRRRWGVVSGTLSVALGIAFLGVGAAVLLVRPKRHPRVPPPFRPEQTRAPRMPPQSAIRRVTVPSKRGPVSVGADGLNVDGVPPMTWGELDRLELQPDGLIAILTSGERRRLLDASDLKHKEWPYLAGLIESSSTGRVRLDLTGLC